MYILSFAAEQDIDDILSYTLSKWGEKQMYSYMALLMEALEKIDKDPELPGFRPVEQYYEGGKRYRVGRHYIYYRVSADFVEIVRILHERMEQGQQFS